MSNHVCGVVEGTYYNAWTQLIMKIEVFFGLEMILKFANVEPRFRLEGLGCIRCGHVRLGVLNGTDCQVEIVMWQTTYVQLFKEHIVTSRRTSV